MCYSLSVIVLKSNMRIQCKTILHFFLIVGLNVIPLFSTFNHCELKSQPECKNTHGHIGCIDHLSSLEPTQENGRQNFSEIPGVSYVHKASFTDKINKFRSSIAENEIKLFNELVANMKVVHWNEELELFATNSIRHRSMHSPQFCAITKYYKHISRFAKYFQSTKILNAKMLLKRFYKSVENTIRAKTKGIERFSTFIDASTEGIGCAFGQYELPSEEDNTNATIMNNTYLVECFLNRARNLKLSEIHVKGDSCSQCHCAEECNSDFVGLCEFKRLIGIKVNCKTNITEQIENTSSTPDSKVPVESPTQPDAPECEMNDIVLGFYEHFYIVYVLLVFILTAHGIFYVYYYYHKIQANK